MREVARWVSCVAVAALGHAAFVHWSFAAGRSQRASTACSPTDSFEVDVSEPIVAGSEKRESRPSRRANAALHQTAPRLERRSGQAVHAVKGTRAPVADPVADGSSNTALEELAPRAALVRKHARARRPRLVPIADICRGVFPEHAAADTGTVTVALRVADSGRPTSLRIVDERPGEQGFAGSARLCVPRLRFEPAVDSAGLPATATSIVRLRFVRGL
jgi:hypothetical protein